MKNLILLIFIYFLSFSTYAYTVSGTAVDSETGEGLGGIELYFSDGQGQVYFLFTEVDGSFQFNNVSNGPHLLEFHYYEPVIINGDYYLYTEYPDTINVEGTNVDGIVFSIPPHHPDYNISGTLYDASTNLPLSDQNISLRLDFASHSGFFFASTIMVKSLSIGIQCNKYPTSLQTEILCISTWILRTLNYNQAYEEPCEL